MSPPPRTHNWDSSKRRPDPPGWKTTRQYVIARAGGLCQHEDGCTYQGSDVDHIVNVANGGSDHVDNLRLLCDWHHKRKTAQEAAKARGPRPSTWRGKEKHPGILD